MKTKALLLIGMAALPGIVFAAGTPDRQNVAAQHKRLTESDRKVEAGRILLKWGGYAEKVQGQSRKEWAAALWPSLASADLDNLQKASRAVTYEGMRNALLGQRPYDEQVIDRMARSKGLALKTLGQSAADLVFTPITPCRIVDTRVPNDRIGAGATRNLDASNPGGNFTSQGGSNTNCGIPANPAALALSVTGLGNTTTGYLRIFPFNGTSAEGSPVPLNSVNTTVTNDIIVPASQGVAQELKVFSTATTHYAAFVTGYFMAPQATALECTVVQASHTLAASGVLNAGSPACPAGYFKTSGSCFSSSYSGRIVSSYPNGAVHYCSWANESAVAMNVVAFAECCRVPG
ncbi:MAG: hypothetical protein EOP02_29840, partial [Proteobacteria bacterium]